MSYYNWNKEQEKILSIDDICEAIEQHRDYFREEHRIVIRYYSITKNLSPTACLITVILVQQDLWGRRFVLQFHRQQNPQEAVKEQLEDCVRQMRKNPDLNIHALRLTRFEVPSHTK